MQKEKLEQLSEMSYEDFISKGICVGHSKTRTHARALSVVKTRKGNFYIINPEVCKNSILKALKYMAELVKDGKQILFVGSRLPHRDFVIDVASTGGYPYLTGKWIGGLLTNFSVIRKRVDVIQELEDKINSEEFKNYTKKEQVRIKRRLAKIKERLEGLRSLENLPDAIFLFSVTDCEEAKKEANKVDIPVIGICDTDANPEGVDYPIFANDDTLPSISFISDLVKEVILKNK